jgi:DNA-directed RNA polymerase subunit RPC12/RpoP
MIHFACVYCGRKVRAKDAQACRKVKCPACGHTLRVPSKGTPPVSQAQAEDNRADAGQQWAGKSDKEIAKLLLKKRPTPVPKTRSMARLVLEPLLPQYDDLTIFALSVAFLLLALTPPGNATPSDQDVLIWQVLYQLIPLSPGFGNLFLLAGLGLIVSLAGTVSNWTKPRWVRFAMLYFAVFATGGIAIAATLLVLMRTRSWPLLVFPLWNGINGAILLIMFFGGIADTDCIVDRRPSLGQLGVTLISILLLLGICRYGLNLHWVMTYSICVCYTLSLNHALQDFFGGHSEPLTTLEEVVTDARPDGRPPAEGMS